MSAPITLTGRLGADPELRFAPSGTAVARLSIVTSRRVKNQQTQEWEDADVTWWDCTAFKQLAENAAATLGKGMAIVASGRAVQENWQDKDGNKRSKIAVKLDSIGPDLNRATARVEKASGGQQRPAQNGQPSGGGWGQQSSQQSSSGWGAPNDPNGPPF
jgi:single-strand DNA-binding protein